MIRLRALRSDDADYDTELAGLAAGIADDDPRIDRQVAEIIGEVRRRGDEALVEYTNRLDRRRVTAAELEIDRRRIQAAPGEIDPSLRAELETAAQRIRAFHERQKAESWSFTDEAGVLLGQKVTPLDRVGVYVPGGRAAYPSTVLMNVIPARVAGVSEIIMVVPAPGDELSDLVLAAAVMAGVDRVFGVGGAQAVAAMAYGTQTVPPVDKIVGPGNRYVAAAKRRVFGAVGIDMIAGPSEVVIVCDGSADPDWIALDLMAQAEHDEEARAILVCTDAGYVEQVQRRMATLLPEMERAAIIRTALEKNGAAIVVADLDEAAEAVNLLAPEHLELAVREPLLLEPKIRHAGAVFLGSHSAEVLGDYCAGPNHVLPTGRTARFSSPLGVYDFVKRSSLMMCPPQAGAALVRTAAALARAEGLTAHARAAECRLRKSAG